MGSELDLLALREWLTTRRDKAYPAAIVDFILKQIERVEACGWCQGNGVMWASIHGEVVNKMPCGAPIYSDVRTFDGRRWRGAVDCVIGGFPCQDLSWAGRQAGIHGEHSGLWWEFARIIREVQPGLVFIENVPPVIHMGAGSAVLGELAAQGFDATIPRWPQLP